MRAVNEILRLKGPHFNFIESNASVFDAITLMNTTNISYLIVLDKGNYSGIVSEGDYVRKFVTNAKRPDGIKVKDIMTTDLPIVSFTDSVEQTMLLMNASRSKYLPVFEDVEFKGIITISDLMHEALEESRRRGPIYIEKTEQHYWI